MLSQHNNASENIFKCLNPLALALNEVINTINYWNNYNKADQSLTLRETKKAIQTVINKDNQERQITIPRKNNQYTLELEKRQAKLLVKLALILAENQEELQKINYEFQALLKDKEWADSWQINKYFQDIQLRINKKPLDFQRWKVAQEKTLVLKLKQVNAEITLVRAAYHRETQFLLMQQRYENDHNPIWLTKRQFLTDKDTSALRIFFLPITTELNSKFPSIKNNADSKLIKLAEYYSSHGRPMKIFTDAWANIKDAQEVTAQALFADYQCLPSLILNRQIEGEYFYLSYSFWQSNADTFRSGVLIDQLSLKNQQYIYAKREVQKWQKLRQQQANPQEIDQLYGLNIEHLKHNSAILEAETQAKNLGIDTDHFHYEVSEKEVKQSLEYLVLLHCLHVGLWADIYFLLYAPIEKPLPPLLLQCLYDLDLYKDYSKEDIIEFVSNFIKSYTRLYQVLSSQKEGVLLPDLYLGLVESCFKVKAYENAKEQVELSIGSWLDYRGIKPQGNILALLQLMKPLIISSDQAYVIELQKYLEQLGISSYMDDLQSFFSILEQEEKRRRQRQEDKKHQLEAELQFLREERKKHQLQSELQYQRQEDKKHQLETELHYQRQEVKKHDLIEKLIPGITLELVEIPAGRCMMGSNQDTNKQPIHEVKVKSFLMSKYPITNGQWKAIMGYEFSTTYDSNFLGDHLPIVNISWYEAKAFCDKLSQKTGKKYRLPTEAEWEFAYRFTAKTKYFLAANDSQLKNNNSSGQIEEKKPNSLGFSEIIENLWEWCLDDWHENYNSNPTDASAWQNNSNTKLFRRGSAKYHAYVFDSAHRGKLNADNRLNNVGMRIVVSY